MRGDVHEVKTPRGARGREQRGRRYAVVVQSDLLPLSTWLVAPTSTSARPASFRPEIEIAGTMTRVLTEQTTAVDQERLGVVVGHLSHAEMSTVDTALRVVLGLDP
ncbi:MAG: type II toxin-antitoxin system PemK/MazF family toxin [Dermatophilaceae bacterium]